MAQKPINIWDANVDNISISNLIEMKNNSKYLIGYLKEVIRPVFWSFLEWVTVLKLFRIDVDKTINQFELRLKTSKILNWMLYQFKTIEI